MKPLIVNRGEKTEHKKIDTEKKPSNNRTNKGN